MSMRYFVGLCMALSSSFAFSQTCIRYQASNAYGTAPGVGDSPSNAVSDWQIKAQALYPATECATGKTGLSTSISIVSNTTTTFAARVTRNYVDWAVNGTKPDGTSAYACVPRSPQIANTNGVIGASPVECAPPPPPTECPLGATKTVNRTMGWAASGFNGETTADLFDQKAPPTGDMNDGKCTGVLSGVTGCYMSTEPAANGMFRVSCDFTMGVTGTMPAGSPTDADADPNTAEPSCPGGQGIVNGKSVCLQEPNTPMQAYDKPPGAPNVQPGNPSAGPKPETGTGSGSDGAGRTPGNGDGGNDGGPGEAAEGTASGKYPVGGGTPGDGTTPEPGEPCGAPGQAICRVKVDETGTAKTGDYTKANSDLDAAATSMEQKIKDTTNVQNLGGKEWSFAFPTGTCSPITWSWKGRQLTVNMCSFPYINLFRQLEAWFIGVLGAVYIWRTASNAVGAA